MHFCPVCGNLLLVEESENGMQFCCPMCTYVHAITKVYSTKIKTKRKQIDDILGGEDAWANVDRTEAKCPACPSNQAFFLQIQIRSADEPMSTFYRCCECSKQWNER